MTEIIAGGVAGLLLGMAAQGMGLGDRQWVSASIALRNRGMLRATLYAMGLGAMLTAFLGWLAVVDVDLLTVLPLQGGTILGAAVFGVAAGLTGVTLGGALTMTGGGRFLEGLCAVIGCLTGAAALPWIEPVTVWAQEWFPAMEQTWFRVTLDEPYLLGGGFLGQACLGAVLAALAVILGPERGKEPAPEQAVRDAQPVSTDAQEVREDTVIATLPGEEPVVVDTAAPEDADDASAGRQKPGDNQPEQGADAAGEDAPEDTDASSAAGHEKHADQQEANNGAAQENGRENAGHPKESAADKDEHAAEEPPVMTEHPELDTPPVEAGDWTEQMARLEEGAGQGTPAQEEALPVGAKAVGVPERREKPEENEPLG